MEDGSVFWCGRDLEIQKEEHTGWGEADKASTNQFFHLGAPVVHFTSGIL